LRRIVVLGGGATGLAVAFRRNENPAPGDDILVLEEGPRAGGSLRTLREEGLVLEAGSHTLRETPSAARLLADLGLADQVLAVDPRTPRWIVRGGKAHPIVPGPAGLLSSALSVGAKARLLREAFVPPRPPERDDESVHDFFTRRFGPDVARDLAEPLAVGVWADDPRTLSARCAFPTLWEAEERSGSVLKAFLSGRRERAPQARTVGLADGLGTVAERLVERSQRAGVRIELNAEVAVVEGPFDPASSGSVWKVQIADGTVYPADTIVSTLDARVLAALLGTRLPRSSARLAELDYARLAVVLMAFRPPRPDGAPRGFGALFPRGEGFRSLGMLYASSLFPSRVPDGVAVVSAFLGGPLDPALPDRTEDELLALVESEIRRLHPAIGPRIYGRVLRWPSAFPRLPVGHHVTLDLLRRDLEGLNEGHERPCLVVTGSWRDGLGLGDRFARADEIAASL
jgi:oxygen-dependent protoporphyrinogen oxidase